MGEKIKLLAEIRQPRCSNYTIKDIREMLDDIPDDYSMSLSGMSDIALLVDYTNKSVLLDDKKYIVNESLTQIDEIPDDELDEIINYVSKMIDEDETKVKIFSKGEKR